MKHRLAAAPLIALIIAAVHTQARAETAAGPCVANAKQIVVCGSGPNPLIVLDGTTSPSGVLAIAWRSKGASRGELAEPEPENVENYLVRLSDGLVLSEVVGRSWANEGGRANHVHHTVAWSPNSHWLIVGDSNKWALEAIAIYAIDLQSAKVTYQGLFRKITSVTQSALRARVGAKRRDEYALDISNDRGIVIANSGAVSVPVHFQIPKEDNVVDLAVRFTAADQGSRITLSPLTVVSTKN